MRSPLFTVALLALVALPAYADVTGKARIIDGDTIEIAGERIRLHGIDAPESKQTCTTDGKKWQCGQEATYALSFETAEHWVTCKGDKRDRYGRIIAVCYVGPYDINARMVRNGWALAYRRYSMEDVDEKDEAKVVQRGELRASPSKPPKIQQKPCSLGGCVEKQACQEHWGLAVRETKSTDNSCNR